MRVLEICEPPDGGAAVNASTLALRLAERGAEVEYAGPPRALPYEELEAAGIPVHRLPLAPSFFNTRADIAALRAIRSLLNGGGFDIVHLHSAKAGVLGRLAAIGGDARVVYSPHSFPFVGDLPRPRIALTTALERVLARRCDAIVCVCDWELRLGRARGLKPRRGLVRIYNGVEPFPDGVEPARELSEWAGGAPLVAAIAVLRRQKRLDLLIEAAPAILAGHPEARVAIVGNGPEGEGLERLVRELGLDREERFRIFPFAASAWEYLAALDVFVLPSAWEAFPIGVLEALAAGVPQVVTDVGGSGEAVLDGVTGFMVPPREPEPIAAAVLDLLGDDERRRRMAAASSQRQLQLFQTATMVEETQALYESLLAADMA